MALPTPPNPNQPIPNHPFYYPLQESLATGSGTALIVGEGICINYASGVISAAGGGPTSGIPCAVITAKGTLIAGLGPSTPGAVALGTNGQFLTVNTACPTGVTWTTATGINVSSYTNKGVILVGTAPGVVSQLPVGLTGCILTANPLCATGVSWSNNTAIPCSIVNKGYVLTGTSAGTPAVVPAGANGQYLTANSACATGIAWSTLPSYIPTLCITDKGTLITGTAFDTPVSLPVGAANQFLRVNPACPTGLQWVTCETIPCSCLAGNIGAMLAGNSTTFGVLSRGNDGQILASDGTCALGLTWCDPKYIPCSLLTAKGQLIVASGICNPTALPVGADDNMLVADSTCVAGMKWQPIPLAGAATPTVLGLTYACTPTVTSQGVALGYCALACSALAPTITCHNIGIGTNAGRSLCNACNNVFIGTNAGCNVITGGNNIFIGAYAGCEVTAGSSGCLLIGRGPVPGFAANYFLCGSALGVKFGTTILGCDGCRGVTGQVLTATGAGGQAMIWSDVRTLVASCAIDPVGSTYSFCVAPNSSCAVSVYPGIPGYCQSFVALMTFNGWWNSSGTSYGTVGFNAGAGLYNATCFNNTGLNDNVAVAISGTIFNKDFTFSPRANICIVVTNQSPDAACFHLTTALQFFPAGAAIP